MGATIFAEGHDLLAARLRGAASGEPAWHEVPMDALGNDALDGRFVVETLGLARVHGRGLGRPVRLLAPRARAQGRGGSGRRERAARRSGPGARRGRTSGRHGRRLAPRARRRARRSRRDSRPRVDAALAPELRAIDGAPSRIATARPSLAPAARRRGRARARGLRRLVRDVSALHVARARPARHACATSRTRLPYVAGDGLRRPLPAADPSRSARRTARGRTTRSTAGAGRPRQPLGHRRRPRAATRPIHPELGTLDDFDRLVARGARARPRDRARHRLPVLARPPLRHASTPSGSGTGPTARSSTPRTRPRSTRTSTRSTSSAPTGAALWDELRDVFLFWIDHGVTHLPRRQPAHQAVRVLGVADRARCSARASRRRSSSPRRSRGRRSCAAWPRSGFTQSYTYFTWRNTKARARPST